MAKPAAALIVVEFLMSVFALFVGIQVLNGVLLPVILICILKLINDGESSLTWPMGMGTTF